MLGRNSTRDIQVEGFANGILAPRGSKRTRGSSIFASWTPELYLMNHASVFALLSRKCRFKGCCALWCEPDIGEVSS